MLARTPRRRIRAARPPILDAAPTARDPSGTSAIRAAMRRDLGARTRRIEREARDVLGEKDLLGLAGPSLASVLSSSAAGDPLSALRRWADATLGRWLAADAAWLAAHLARAREVGVASVRRRLDLPELLPPPDQLLAATAREELRALAEVVAARIVRACAEVMRAGGGPRQAARAALDVLRRVLAPRGEVMVDYLAVSAAAEGALDAMEMAGVRRAGVIPETRHHRATEARDAEVEDAPRRRYASEIPRIERRERRLERRIGGALVNSVTAGDDRVCARCEEIARRGPYTLDQARGLIPAHPHCRCALEPVVGEDEEVGDAYDPNQPRDVIGRWTAGEYVPARWEEAFGGEEMKARPNEPNTVGVGTDRLRVDKELGDYHGHRKIQRRMVRLTEDEEYAIMSYTTGASNALNHDLRSGDDVRDVDMLSGLDSALRRSELPRDVSGYRAVHDEVWRTLRAQVGKLVTDRGYTGVAVNPEGLAGDYTGDRIVEMRLPAGTRALPIAHLSEVPEETEILVARGTTYGVDWGEGGRLRLTVRRQRR